ncbi:MAG: putative small lipoprotein YifL [Candidatus Azotimanducaceae bacterium]|jgi:predicted small lipoprotein YifL
MRILGCLLLLCCISACGQKGPLFLPEAEEPEAITVSS